MFQSIIFCTVLYSLLITSTLSLQSIVVQVKGDCKQLGNDIAQEHGYRYVRQVEFFLVLIEKFNILFRFSMDIVKLKKIHRQLIIFDIGVL